MSYLVTGAHIPIITTTLNFAYVGKCTYILKANRPPSSHLKQSVKEITHLLINVCTESPIKTVSFITALQCVKLYMPSFDVELLERYEIHLLLMKKKQFM